MGEVSDLEVSVQPRGEGRWSLKAKMPEAWAKDPARRYPVVLDPAITWWVNADTFVIEGMPDTNFFGLKAKSIPGEEERYLRTAGTEPQWGLGQQEIWWYLSPDDARDAWFSEVLNVKVWAWAYWQRSCNNPLVLRLPTQDWRPDTLTWNNRPPQIDTGFTIGGCPGTDYGKGWITASDSSGFLRQAFQNWLDGTWASRGISLAGDTASLKILASILDNHPGPGSKGPHIDITYNRPPYLPRPTSPGPTAVLSSYMPRFCFQPSGDPDGDPVSYQVRVSGSPTFKANLITSPWMSGQGELCWQMPGGLLRDGATYYWGVFASDGRLEAPSRLRPPEGDWLRTIRLEVKRLGTRPYYGMVPFSIGSRARLEVNAENGNAILTVPLPSYPTATQEFSGALVYNSRAKDDFGLQGTYYQHDCRGPKFPTGGAKIIRVDSLMSFDWRDGSPDPSIGGDCFSARWVGYILIPEDDYYLGVRHDDGVRVEIDGQTVIDAWGGPSDLSVSPRISKGLHSIKVEYYENTGGAQVQLRWARGTTDRQAFATVPASAFLPRRRAMPLGWDFTKSLIGSVAASSLEVVSESQVLLYTDDGSPHAFTWNGSAWEPPAELGNTALSRAGDGTWTYLTEDGSQHVFDATGRLKHVLTPSDASTPPSGRKPSFTYQYDAAQRLRKIIDIAGREIRFDYVEDATSPANGFLLQITYFDGRVTTLEYNSAGRLIGVTNPGGAKVGFEYIEPSGLINLVRPTRSFDEGVVYRWRIDYDIDPTSKLPRVKVVSAPPAQQGQTQRADTTFSYVSRTETGSTTRITDPAGTNTEMTFDSAGRVVSTKDPAGLETKTSYDFMNNVTRIESPDQTVTEFQYDALGRMVAQEGPKVDPITGRRLRSTVAFDEGLSGVYAEYYANRNLSGAASPPGPALVVTEGSIGGNWGSGGPTSAVPTDNFSIRYRGVFVAPVTGNYRFYARADDGVRVYLGNPQNPFIPSLVVDDWSIHGARETSSPFLVSLEAGQSIPITVEYFEAGGDALLEVGVEVEGVLAKQRIRREWLRPSYGLVTSVIAPDGTRTRIEYNAQDVDPVRGLPTRRRLDVLTSDGRIQTLTQDARYDQYGRLTDVSRNGGEQAAHIDYYGLTEKVSLPPECGGGGLINQAGLPKKVTYSAPAEPTQEVIYGALGRPRATKLGTPYEGWACVRYDERGRVARIEPAVPFASAGVERANPVTYEYNGDDATVVADDSEGGRIEQAYDRLGRLISHKDAAGGTTSYTYDPAGRLTSQSGPAGVETYTYDQASRPQGGTWNPQIEGQASLSSSISYDWAGRVASISRSGGFSTSFRYSPTSEVAEIIHAQSGQVFDRFVYLRDDFGRVKTASVAPDPRSYFYDRASRLVASRQGEKETDYTFDRRTNRTQDESYTSAKRPTVGAEPATSYVTGAKGIWVYTPEQKMRAGRAPGNHDALLVWGPDTYSDVDVSAKLRFLDGERDAGIQLRWRNGGRNRYIVAFRASDTALHKVTDGTLVTKASVPRPHSVGEELEVLVKARGQRIEVFEKNAEGAFERVISFQDSYASQEAYERSGFNQGAVGLFSWNSTTDFDDFSVEAAEGSRTLVFDDFRLYSLDLDSALARWQQNGDELYHYSTGSLQENGLLFDPSIGRMKDGEVRFKIRFDEGDPIYGFDAGVRLRRDPETRAAYHVVIRRRPGSSNGELVVFGPGGFSAVANLGGHPVRGNTYSVRVRMETVMQGGTEGVRFRVWIGGAAPPSQPGAPHIDATNLPTSLAGVGGTAIYSWGSAVGFTDLQLLPLAPTANTSYVFSTADRLTSVVKQSQAGPTETCTSATGCIAYDYRGNTTRLQGSEYRFDTQNRMVWSRSVPEPINPRIHPLGFSPASQRVAFSSRRDGPEEVYTAATDGSGLSRLTFSEAGIYNRNPRFSPDGSRIVFTSNREGDEEIYTMRADGSDVVRLTYSPGKDDMPAYSPDGSKIVFVSDRDGQVDL